MKELEASFDYARRKGRDRATVSWRVKSFHSLMLVLVLMLAMLRRTRTPRQRKQKNRH